MKNNKFKNLLSIFKKMINFTPKNEQKFTI